MTLPLIKIVQLTLTNRCQCRCEHCGVAKLRQAIAGELTMPQINALLQDFKLAGCLLIDLFGGEPTLRSDLCEIIKLAKSYGFKVSLETNGYVIDRDYMQRLCRSGLDQIYLSLDDYRADFHDRRRRTKGSFERAVRALELGSEAGMMMHVSIVPQTRDYFTSGDMNRFAAFALAHGAEKIRLLLPRFVGGSIRADSGPMCAGGEPELFSHVSPEYKAYIYVHTPGTPLGETNVCTAKQVFCHVMSNGWVAPCPYFPLVFGDAIREPIVDIFERIQAHPLVRLGGDFCPMRNEQYIDSHIRELGLDRPFFPITVNNLINLGAPCTAGCPDCDYGRRTSSRPAAEVIRELSAIAPEYARIEFYGGDAFSSEDLFAILDRVPPAAKVTLWSICGRPPMSRTYMERLRSYPVEALKVYLPASFLADMAHPAAADRLAEALRNVSHGGDWRFPVYLYIPMNCVPGFHTAFAGRINRLGVDRLYAFIRRHDDAVENAAACFGRELERLKLLWVRR